MANFYIFVATLAMVHCGSQATVSHSSSGSRSVGLSLSSTKNDSGQSTDLFSARKEHSSALHSITMDVQHNITRNAGESEVGSNVTISNNGTTVEDTDESEKGMVFHSRVGANVIISNNGTTIEKKDINYYYGAAFTCRPLKNDELFEVMLAKRGSKFTDGFGIGVMTVRPEDYEFPTYIDRSSNVWIYIGTDIWNNGDIKRSDYGVNLNHLPAGTRFGVMRKSSDGDIHFYVNGEDQGSAVSGISGPIYGVAELRGNAEKTTILKP